jgi:hypothetical protein
MPLSEDTSLPKRLAGFRIAPPFFDYIPGEFWRSSRLSGGFFGHWFLRHCVEEFRAGPGQEAAVNRTRRGAVLLQAANFGAQLRVLLFKVRHHSIDDQIEGLLQ